MAFNGFQFGSQTWPGNVAFKCGSRILVRIWLQQHALIWEPYWEPYRGVKAVSATVVAIFNFRVERRQYLTQVQSQQQDKILICLSLQPWSLDLEPQTSYLRSCIVKAHLVLALFPGSASDLQVICLLLLLSLILLALSLDSDRDLGFSPGLACLGWSGLVRYRQAPVASARTSFEIRHGPWFQH